MKDIDFLPEWYKSGKRRQIAYRTQYVILGGMLLLMCAWNYMVGRSVSIAEGQVARMAERQLKVGGASDKFMRLKTEITKLQDKLNTIEKIDSRIDVAAVMGELSYLIDKNVTLVKLDILSESFQDPSAESKPGTAVAVLRAVKSGGSGGGNAPLGDVRFKLIISGVAGSGSDVMSLVSRLESSKYFSHFVLSYSRDSEIQIDSFNGNTSGRAGVVGSAGTSQGNQKVFVSEFEIKCYLANYEE